VNYQKILTATDFSPASSAALQRAAALAKASGADLHIVHVVEALMYRGVVYKEPLTPNSKKEEKAAAKEALAEAIDGLGDDHVPVSAKVLIGDSRNAITKHAEKIGADLIVIGSHGHGRLHDALLGNVAGHISQVAPCSVLIVRG